MSMCQSHKFSIGRWMENVLKRIMHFLKSVVRRLDISEIDRKKRLKESQSKLQTLRTKSDEVIVSLRADLHCSIDTVCEEVRKYLQRHDVQMRLTALWRPDEIPTIDDASEISSNGTWAWLKGRIDTAFYDRYIPNDVLHTHLIIFISLYRRSENVVSEQ